MQDVRSSKAKGTLPTQRPEFKDGQRRPKSAMHTLGMMTSQTSVGYPLVVSVDTDRHYETLTRIDTNLFPSAQLTAILPCFPPEPVNSSQ